MPTISLEKRVAALEAEMERLKQQRHTATTSKLPWWEQIRGTFKDDPEYVEAMRLGREWRNAQLPERDDTA